MKNVIEQIAAIDAVAFENERKNEEILNNKRKQYENVLRKYREQKLKRARSEADSLYEQIIAKTREELQAKEAELKNKTEQLEKNFKKMEKQIIKSIFDMLFNQ
ncbi:MAG: hypothetical protein ACM3XR_04695 [Bacillota bacterium]